MSPPIVLNEHPLSPYAQKIRILLREKGVPFESRLPTGIGSGGANPELTRQNPREEVPSIEHDGATLFESTVILEYLEEVFPEPALMPRTPKARARARLIEDVCDTHWEAINWGLGEVRFFGRGGAALAPVLRAAAGEQLGHLYGWLEHLLGDAPWLGGSAFGWGDMAALPFVTMSSMFGFDPPQASRAAAWLERAMARSSVAATVAEARATVPGMEGVAELVRGGAFKRQFRDHRLEWMIRSGGLQVVLDGLANDDIRFTDLRRFAHSAFPS